MRNVVVVGLMGIVGIVVTACGGGADDPGGGGADTIAGGSGGGGAGPTGAPSFAAGAGSSTSDDGGASSAAASGALVAVVRDFRLFDPNDGTTVPDFENYPHVDPRTGAFDPGYEGDEDDRGVVTSTLGADGKPVYAKAQGGTLTTHGKTAFDTWYHDTPGANLRVQIPLQLSTGADGASSYASAAFFPIDDGTPYATNFGNQGDAHNYSFTVEIHTVFTYRGGEVFDFRGDDDVFVYVDQKLVIDLGGIHGPETAHVAIDDLHLDRGKDHTLDFFSAERHRTGSDVLFTTTLGLRPASIK